MVNCPRYQTRIREQRRWEINEITKKMKIEKEMVNFNLGI
jgi:hypothetical protein